MLHARLVLCMHGTAFQNRVHLSGIGTQDSQIAAERLLAPPAFLPVCRRLSVRNSKETLVFDVRAKP